MEKIKVILVDDHRIVRDGIKSILVSEEDIEIIGEANSFSELQKILEKSAPDIVVVDISLTDISGIEIVKILSLKYPEIKTMMLTMYTDEDFIFNSIKAGAKSYLPKNTTKKELIEAIHTVFNGEEYYSESIKNIMLKSYIKKVQEDKQINYSRILTRREEEILKLYVQGFGNKEIAEKLFISARTVESHKNHIMNKLELKSNVELILFAIKNKIIDIE